MQTFRDPTTLKASIDGVPLKNLAQYRVKSPVFDVTFPANNIWGVKGGPTRSAADTYIIFLKPLSPGKHVFTFSASSPVTPPSPLKPNPEPPHTLAIKYKLIVGKIDYIKALNRRMRQEVSYTKQESSPWTPSTCVCLNLWK